MKSTQETTGDASALSPVQIQWQIDRIASSSGLKNSGPILNVFLFLGKNAVDNAGVAVKEHEIATSALGRPPDFDPRLDSTVRVVVMRLRARLAEYYTHEGIDDPILIDIPKGTYCLLVTRRAVTEPPLYDAAGVTPDVPEGKGPLSIRPRLSRRFTITFGALLILGLAATSFWLGRYSVLRPQPAEVRIFWDSLLESGDPLVVFSNPIFQGTPETGMHLLDPGAFHTDGTNDTFTGAGEVMAVHDLSQQLTLLHHTSRVKRARLFTWDEALANNLIIVGGPAQSSVSKQLSKLQKFVLKGPTQEPFPGQVAIRDAQPGSGQQYYVASVSRDAGIDYAVVALTPGPSQDHWVLILAGTDTYGTEAAARFVCHPRSLNRLFAKLAEQKPHADLTRTRFPFFEALLKLELRGGAPLEPEIVCVYPRSS